MTMSEEQKPQGEILGELRLLGQQLASTVKALWESDDTRNLREQVRTGFVELGQNIDGALKAAQESEAGRQIGEQVKQTATKVRESEVAEKVEEGVVAGLRELNKQLGELVRSWTKPAEPPAEPPPGGPENAD